MKEQDRLQHLLSLTASVVLALAVGALIMALTGHSPAEGYGALLNGVFGSKRGIASMLYKSAQLAITGIATIVASRGGVFNVGGEGQMYLGALAAAWMGTLLKGVSPWLAIPICLLTAIAAGAFYAWIPAVLKVKLKVNEVITTILMNTIALKFCTWMATGPLHTTERGVSQGTQALNKSFLFQKLVPGAQLNTSVYLVVLATVLVWYLMQRTSTGFEMNLTGQNPRFSRFIGISADRMAILGMLISGGLCGLLGMSETFGVQSRFRPDFSSEFYFDGMLVAMIMQYKPLGTILMSFFFGLLKIGGVSMQSKTGISSELILIVQSIIIFFMAAEKGIAREIQNKRAARAALQAHQKAGGTA